MHFSETTDQLTEEVEWFLDNLAVERGASHHTVLAYHTDLKQIGTFLRKWNLKSWSQYDEAVDSRVRGVLASLSLAQSSISRKASSVRSLLRFLIKRGSGPPSGMLEPTRSHRARPLPKALTVDELTALLSAPDVSSPSGMRDRVMLEALYGTGLRVSELVSLRTEDYVATESVLRILGKRQKTRLVPVPAGTKDWFDRYLVESRSAMTNTGSGSSFFVNRRGRPLSRSGVFRILQGYAKRAGMTKAIGPHTLRHSYAVHLVQAGADLRSVQELLGHESVATTDIYTQLDGATLRRKYDRAHPRAKS